MDLRSARVVSTGSWLSLAFKKKLYQYRPDRPPQFLETYRTGRKKRIEPADPRSLERNVRQLLGDRTSGNMLGLWLLVPEHLRLGTWDVLCRWTGQSTECVQPRLALQLVHESALCVTGIRQSRHLSQRGFELLNGLPFVASDIAIHDLLEAHTVEDAQALQIHLGLLRRARGHFAGEILAIDPHRIQSYSKRQMRRYPQKKGSKPVKVSQVFFCLDTDTKQPVCFTIGSSALSVLQATPALLRLTADILNCSEHRRPLVVADTEHYVGELLQHVKTESCFDLLILMPNGRSQQAALRDLNDDLFTTRWAGFATAKRPYKMKYRDSGALVQYIQRSAEKPEEYDFKAFLSTRDTDEVEALSRAYPQRWHVEEFFNAHQALGWNRAGTMNLNIRYGHMSMALIAQAVIHEFRQRVGIPWAEWDAKHMANAVFRGIDGSLQVSGDTTLVTLYSVPAAEKLRPHYEDLPRKLAAEGIDPHIPWLYGYKLDFRFK
jgi:hypothetical protein